MSAHTQMVYSENTYENDRDKLRQFIHRVTFKAILIVE